MGVVNQVTDLSTHVIDLPVGLSRLLANYAFLPLELYKMPIVGLWHGYSLVLKYA